jgi:septal ring factor EnvC (AmiA/AmiB activator)
MSNQATRKDIDEVIGILHSFMHQVGDEFKAVNNKIDAQDDKYDKLINTINDFISRIDRYETELVARDAKIERLERWIKEIAKKTNTALPN